LSDNGKNIEVRINPLRIYADASLLFGCENPEFQRWSWSLIRDFRQETYIPVISTLLQEQTSGASDEVQKALAELLACKPKIIVVSEKAETLADIYLERKVLEPQFREEALHVALATLEEVDVLTSWNYRNILHISKVRKFITVNIELGLKPIQIRSPRIIASLDIQNPEAPSFIASDDKITA
jgi:hypothetical protein